MFYFQKPFPFLPDLKSPCWYNDQRELRCLPFFFLIGIPKCGTTDVFNMLSLHPDFRTSSKEPHWLARTRYYQNPPLTLDQYTKAMAASFVQTERKSMGVKEVNQSFYELALGEVLRTRHNRVLGMYRLRLCFTKQTSLL